MLPITIIRQYIRASLHPPRRHQLCENEVLPRYFQRRQVPTKTNYSEAVNNIILPTFRHVMSPSDIRNLLQRLATLKTNLSMRFRSYRLNLSPPEPHSLGIGKNLYANLPEAYCIDFIGKHPVDYKITVFYQLFFTALDNSKTRSPLITTFYRSPFSTTVKKKFPSWPPPSDSPPFLVGHPLKMVIGGELHPREFPQWL